MLYIRPQEYYANLARKLNESELAKTSRVADICLASSIEADDDSSYVSGLVNTGNTCFMNSVLQALSSLPHLHSYLERVSHVATGVPLPVTRSLLKTIRSLTVPLYRRSSFRPVDIVTALSSNRRVISREQQDAQEFFQLVSSAVDAEGQLIAKTEQLGGGLRDLLSQTALKGVIRPQWGAIRHFSFNNIQLNVPNKYTTTLEECLSQFTSMEYLQDAACRKCSFEATVKALTAEIESLKQHPSRKQKNDTKTKRETVVKLVSLERSKQEIEHRLRRGRIEEENDHDKVPLLRSVASMSSKHVMLAKPPKILCLHISRSAFLSTGAIYKNTCQILFPEYLDVSPFSTNGVLHTQPTIPISTLNENGADKGFYYRLMSVVVHYGSHSFGHFVAFKRRIYADQCKCYQCAGVDLSAKEKAEDWKCQNSWYRISDSKVDECSIEDVKRSNPYMLLYELMNQDDMDARDQEDEDEDQDQEWNDEEQGVKDSMTDFETGARTDNASTTTNTNAYNVYNNIPTDDAAKEALRIATALMMEDQKQ
ncbi:hypothetical protein [Parasitella parasitica]|uniref:Ubiquitin carboxyl-terminal hydrolase n=1 Tax=Parasitella parasitica TaxID=35722 RepID=A0A0B7NK94_9FUNG|nr:hypothetical protein [Parasitella parasitica]